MTRNKLPCRQHIQTELVINLIGVRFEPNGTRKHEFDLSQVQSTESSAVLKRGLEIKKIASTF